MKKILLISALLFSNVLFAKTIEYKIEKEESGKSVEELRFLVDTENKRFYHKEENIKEEIFKTSITRTNGIDREEHQKIKIGSLVEVEILQGLINFAFSDTKKLDSIKVKNIDLINTKTISANVKLDLENVNKERKSMLKVDDIEFFISATEK